MEVAVTAFTICLWALLLVDGYLFVRSELSFRRSTLNHMFLVHITNNDHERVRSAKHVIAGNIALPMLMIITLLGIFAFTLVTPSLTITLPFLAITQTPIIYPIINRWWMHKHVC